MSPTRPILSVRGLKVSRGGVPVLDVPAFDIFEGEFLSLIGGNGAGKSTLLLSLSGLIRRDDGEIRFRGNMLSGRNDMLGLRRKITMVFQEPLLFDTSVFDNVASGLKFHGYPGKQIHPIVEEYLALFGIGHLSGRSARKLSGGESQRTSLARAFALQPEMIFLDEPFASLDPPTKEALIEDLSSVMRKKGITAVMATHDRMDALRLSDRIAVMDRGSVVQIGDAAAVMNRPVNETVAAFVGMETIIEGTVCGSNDGLLDISVDGIVIRAVGGFETGRRVMCFIRPEQVTIDTSLSRSSARNVFSGRIEKITPMGFFYRVSIDCGFLLSAHVTHQALQDLGLSEGTEVAASFKATSVHVIKR